MKHKPYESILHSFYDTLIQGASTKEKKKALRKEKKAFCNAMYGVKRNSFTDENIWDNILSFLNESPELYHTTVKHKEMLMSVLTDGFSKMEIFAKGTAARYRFEYNNIEGEAFLSPIYMGVHEQVKTTIEEVLPVKSNIYQELYSLTDGPEKCRLAALHIVCYAHNMTNITDAEFIRILFPEAGSKQQRAKAKSLASAKTDYQLIKYNDYAYRNSDTHLNKKIIGLCYKLGKVCEEKGYNYRYES